jgi:nucleolar protein 9
MPREHKAKRGRREKKKEEKKLKRKREKGKDETPKHKKQKSQDEDSAKDNDVEITGLDNDYIPLEEEDGGATLARVHPLSKAPHRNQTQDLAFR